jgi:3-mercaptopyruvate sulfurtransferase SseA
MDGNPDLLLGADTQDVTWLFTLAGSSGVRALPGNQLASWSDEGGELGARVEPNARDVDGDGVLDVAMAAPAGDGVVYVLGGF